MASKQLQSFLAMPAPMRSLLLYRTSSLYSPSHQPRLFSTSPLHRVDPRPLDSRPPSLAALVIPEFRTSPIRVIRLDELFKFSSFSSLPSTAPYQTLQYELYRLFTENPASFAHGGLDFYELKKNTRVPEVCILGRSNVGKSSFVNALANRRRGTLAAISSQAGRTRSINTYGFGPAPLMSDLAGQAATYKGKEDIPTHAFHLVDMPGYGHASQEEWGRNIELFLMKRTNLKGAVVLIDAEVGPKRFDFHLLEMLSVAGVRTAIVLTKADKVSGGLDGLRRTCAKIWDGMYVEHAENVSVDRKWLWEKEVYITAVGAKQSALRSATVAAARLAVARLAGLVKDKRLKPANTERWSGKVVSFDDLQLSSSKSPDTDLASAQPSQASPSPQPPIKINKSPITTTSPFVDLERASRVASGRAGRSRPAVPERSLGRTRTSARRAPAPARQTRALHSTVSSPAADEHELLEAEAEAGTEIEADIEASAESRDAREQRLQRALDEFLQTLTIKDTPYERMRRTQQARERRQSPKLRPETRAKSTAKLQKLHPEIAERSREVLQRRLEVGGHSRTRLREDEVGEEEEEGSLDPFDAQIREGRSTSESGAAALGTALRDESEIRRSEEEETERRTE